MAGCSGLLALQGHTFCRITPPSVPGTGLSWPRMV